jgi:hypothetical protein
MTTESQHITHTHTHNTHPNTSTHTPYFDMPNHDYAPDEQWNMQNEIDDDPNIYENSDEDSDIYPSDYDNDIDPMNTDTPPPNPSPCNSTTKCIPSPQAPHTHYTPPTYISPTCPKFHQYSYSAPKTSTKSDLPIPLGLISVSVLHKAANTELSIMINDIYTLSHTRGKGIARALIAHAINDNPACSEIHLVIRSLSPQQEKARALLDDISLTIASNPDTHAMNTDGSDIHIHTSTQPQDNTEEEYRLSTRLEISKHMTMRMWQTPIIKKHTFTPQDPISSDVLNLIHEASLYHTDTFGDQKDIHDIIRKSDHTYIAYDDPLDPRRPDTTTGPQIPARPDTPPVADTSTPIRTRKHIRNLSKHTDAFHRGRAYIGDPSILYRTHTMTRSELEYNILYAEKCLMRLPSTHTPGYLLKPSRRRLITSRWTSRAADSYRNMIYKSDVPIT